MAASESINQPPFDWGDSVRIVDPDLVAKCGYSVGSVCGNTVVDEESTAIAFGVLRGSYGGRRGTSPVHSQFRAKGRRAREISRDPDRGERPAGTSRENARGILGTAVRAVPTAHFHDRGYSESPLP